MYSRQMADIVSNACSEDELFADNDFTEVSETRITISCWVEREYRKSRSSAVINCTFVLSV